MVNSVGDVFVVGLGLDLLILFTCMLCMVLTGSCGFGCCFYDWL